MYGNAGILDICWTVMDVSLGHQCFMQLTLCNDIREQFQSQTIGTSMTGHSHVQCTGAVSIEIHGLNWQSREVICLWIIVAGLFPLGSDWLPYTRATRAMFWPNRRALASLSYQYDIWKLFCWVLLALLLLLLHALQFQPVSEQPEESSNPCRWLDPWWNLLALHQPCKVYTRRALCTPYPVSQSTKA